MQFPSHFFMAPHPLYSQFNSGGGLSKELWESSYMTQVLWWKRVEWRQLQDDLYDAVTDTDEPQGTKSLVCHRLHGLW